MATTFSNLYIGTLSGTSMDSIDTALVEIHKNKLKLINTIELPIDDALRQEILAVCTPGMNGIHRMATLDVKFGKRFAESVLALLEKTNLQAKDIAAIGSHGQNIRHMPNNEPPYTLQIGDPNIIAAETGITTVGDFRRRDLALGGQGAPLTPAFHQFLFQHITGTQWVVNIGGICNITLLKTDTPILGFDTGPGNTLLDRWCFTHTGKSFDAYGNMARKGIVHAELLSRMMSDSYFEQAPPKSTGIEYFNLAWLKQHLSHIDETLPVHDVQATLVELTAATIAASLNTETAEHIWVCGGGAKNSFLMERLQAHCNTKILSTDAMGVSSNWLEACAFAWFAYQTVHRKTTNLPSVTGASRASVLGAIYCHAI